MPRDFWKARQGLAAQKFIKIMLIALLGRAAAPRPGGPASPPHPARRPPHRLPAPRVTRRGAEGPAGSGAPSRSLPARSGAVQPGFRARLGGFLPPQAAASPALRCARTRHEADLHPHLVSGPCTVLTPSPILWAWAPIFFAFAAGCGVSS